MTAASKQLESGHRAREGSPWTGLWAVVFKEMADLLTSTRMRILEVLIPLTAIGAAWGAMSQIRQTIGRDVFLFLKLFTVSQASIPSFVEFLSILMPLIAISLTFRAKFGNKITLFVRSTHQNRQKRKPNFPLGNPISLSLDHLTFFIKLGYLTFFFAFFYTALNQARERK